MGTDESTHLKITVMLLGFLTDQSWQTVQTQLGAVRTGSQLTSRSLEEPSELDLQS